MRGACATFLISRQEKASIDKKARLGGPLISGQKGLDVRNLFTGRRLILVMVGLAIILILTVAFNQGAGQQLLPASTLAYATCFVLTMYFLRNRTYSLFEIILTAASSMFSGVWLYELVYHYFWGTSLGSISYDFLHFSIVLYPGWPFPIWFAIPVILFPFLKRQYISLNKPLVVISAVAIGSFALWFNLGLPQFFYPQYYDGTLFTTNQVITLGYTMNSITKLLAVVPAFLFCDRGKMNIDAGSKATVLQNLRSAFLLLLVGGILAALPAVGSVGMIVMVAGLFILILSVRALERSTTTNSEQSEHFRLGLKRFIWGLIIGLIILLVGAIVITAPLGSLIESLASNQNTLAALNDISQIVPGFRNILYEVLGIVIAAYFAFIFAWLSLCSSIRTLAGEFSQRKFRLTANLYSVFVIIGFFSVVSLFLFILSGNSGLFLGTSYTTVHLYNILFYGTCYGFFTGGTWLIFTLIFLVESAIIVAGSFLAYSSAKNALAGIHAGELSSTRSA